jgi:hypothetical protein
MPRGWQRLNSWVAYPLRFLAGGPSLRSLQGWGFMAFLLLVMEAGGPAVSFRQDCMTYLEGHQAYEGVLCTPRTM